MILLFQERKPIESNHFICNAIGTEEVSNSFRDKKDDLNENISEVCACVCNCSSENAELIEGVEMYNCGEAAAGAVFGTLVFEPKSSNMSSTVERCDGGGEVAEAFDGVDWGADEPKISARSCWLF